ncbi:hypothetical protein V5O48_007856 [Marasmius crinis-equi]|uniref:Uncharacterized protein n=1 Tax=Marasmius crinis-equi TaxID=585013 RepID=A0ABR3FFH1_9AGAR
MLWLSSLIKTVFPSEERTPTPTAQPNPGDSSPSFTTTGDTATDEEGLRANTPHGTHELRSQAQKSSNMTRGGRPKRPPELVAPSPGGSSATGRTPQSSGSKGSSKANQTVRQHRAPVMQGPPGVDSRRNEGDSRAQATNPVWDQRVTKTLQPYAPDKAKAPLDSSASRSREGRRKEASVSPSPQRENEPSLHQAYNDLNTEKQALVSDHRRLRVQFDHQSSELQHLKGNYEALQTLLTQRTKELQDAQTYLISTRSLSEADIIYLVDALNMEIFSAAASIFDTLCFDQFASTIASPSRLQELAEKQLSAVSRKNTMSWLVHRPSGDDLDIIMQSALRYLMVNECRDLIQSWSVDGGALNDDLDGVYRKIRRHNPQSVAGRWRAMTKTQTKCGGYDRLEKNTRSRMIEHIRALILQWEEELDKAAQAEVQRKIETKVRVVVDRAAQLDRVLGTDVIAEDWEVFGARSGDEFDWSCMEDAFAKPQGSGFGGSAANESTGMVICPTGLGLRRRVDEDSTNGEWQIMSKVKVLLDTAFVV